jgi:hypothetical protein
MGWLMNAVAYNKKIAFIAEKGDLSVRGSLYQEYYAVFDEWYGDLIEEDYLVESGYPEIDFKEWFKSRLMDSYVEKRFDPEIAESFLDAEIERMYHKVK